MTRTMDSRCYKKIAEQGSEDLVIYRAATLVIWNDRGIFSPNVHQPSYTRVLVDLWPST
jgi:hypothetical protein